MAVRFDADGEDYTRSLGLGTLTQLSVTCWVKLSANRATYSTAWCIDSGATSDYTYLQTNSDGVSMALYQNGVSAVGNRTLTVGTWYFWGVAVNGANLTVASRAATETTTTISTASTGDASGTSATTLRLGESVYTGEWLNGCLAAVKIWNAALTQAELEAEADRYLPGRTQSLAAWYPLLAPETTDYSGANRTLSGGTGTAVENGPPISWRAGRRAPFIPASATSKTLADTASATQQLTVTATPALADTAAAANALAANASSSLADSANATQSLAVSVVAALADTATSAESSVAGVPKAVGDAGAAGESLALAALVPLSQPAVAADTVTAAAQVGLTQSGAAADALVGGLLLAKSFGDGGAATDAIAAAVARIIRKAKPPLTRWSAQAPETRWVAGAPHQPWAAGSPETRWSASAPSSRYSAGPPMLEEV